MADKTQSGHEDSAVEDSAAVGPLWSALAVRATELDQTRRLFIAAGLVGFAMVFFFSGSNALFLAEVGSESLPWVYLTNAPIVIAGGLGYAAWSRRASTRSVLQRSIWFLTAAVTALWLWAWQSEGGPSAFALAVAFRFLFIFGLLGLWEISSAVFDVRQSKRLFPAVALGSMLAFMVGGALVGAISSLFATVHLIALSAVFFGLYAIAFRRAIHGASFDAADASSPATPAQIVRDPFSRDLALMRSITILLIFITEFIFYEQVESAFGSDETIARFLGAFMAVSTLVLVVFTATASARIITRFGVGVGLTIMPVALGTLASVMGVYGLVFGVNAGFFALAVFANLVNMTIANAIETPVGAVMYQPMPIEQRMPVRVAVDGWLGSVALIVAGLLLLLFNALQFSSVLPFTWLLAAIGLAGAVLARRLYRHYLTALDTATTVAFSGAGSHSLLAGIDADRGLLPGGLAADAPGAAFALSTWASGQSGSPLELVLPDLAQSPDPAVALLALDAIADSTAGSEGASSSPDRVCDIVAGIATDSGRPRNVRARALRCLHVLDPVAATGIARQQQTSSMDEFDAIVRALQMTTARDDASTRDIVDLTTSSHVNEQLFAAATIGAVDARTALPEPVQEALHDLLRHKEAAVREAAIEASHGRVDAAMANTLITMGNQPQDRRRAVAALASGGTVSVDALDGVIDTLPDPYVVDLVDHVYAPHTRRPPILHQFLDPETPSALRRAGFDAARRADVALPATLPRLLRDDVAFAHVLMATSRDAGGPRNQAAPLIDLVLADEFATTREAVWAGLRLAADTNRIREVEQLTHSPDDDARANAIEVLDTLLPHSIRSLVVPILEPRTIREATEIAVDLPDATDASTALGALHDHPRISRSTRDVLAHYCAPAHQRPDPKDDMSDIIDRVLALKRVDIFATLPYEVLAELGHIAERREVPAGEVIIAEGDFGDELFALTDGSVRVERNTTTVTLEAGTVFGELAVLDPGPRTASVIAACPCVLLSVGRPMLLALTDRRPEVMAEIARVLSARLRNTVS